AVSLVCRLQNTNFSPNWICRAAFNVELTWPPFPELMAPEGALNVGWLKMLKNSERNSSCLDSVMRKRLPKVKSNCLRPSALRMFRPLVPYRRSPVRASGGRAKASAALGKRVRQVALLEVKNQQLTSWGRKG